MKALTFTVPLMALGCLVVLMTTSCEENTSSALDPAAVDVTGTWSLQDDSADAHTMTLSQSGSQITGSISAFVGQTTPIVGFISDISITMFMSVGTTNAVNFVGTASENSMSGSWQNSNTQQGGTWTAVRK